MSVISTLTFLKMQQRFHISWFDPLKRTKKIFLFKKRQDSWWIVPCSHSSSSSVQAVEYSTPQVYYLGGLFHAPIPALVLYRPWNVPHYKFVNLVECSMFSFKLKFCTGRWIFLALIQALVLNRPWNIPRHKFVTLVECSMLSFKL